MGLFARLIGITGNFFNLGGAAGTGAAAPSQLANQATAPATTNGVEMRNVNNTAFINARGLDPIVPQDFATKNYVDTNANTTADVKMISIPIAQASPVDSTTVIPNNAIVVDSRITITTPYAPSTVAIEVGNTGNAQAFQFGADSTPSVNGTYDAPQRTPNTPASVAVVTILGAPTAGAGFVDVFYVVTPNP